MAVKQQTASALFPQIEGNLNAGTSRNSSGGGDTGMHNTSDSYSYGATASQLLFDGAKTINNVNAAKENIKASQQGYKFTSTQVGCGLGMLLLACLSLRN